MRVSKCDKCGGEIDLVNPVMTVTYDRGRLTGFQTVDLCHQCHPPYIKKLQREGLLKKEKEQKQKAA